MRRGEATGALPHLIAPWNTTVWVDYSRALAPGLSAEPRVEDIFRGRNPGPFQDEDPTSVNYNLEAQPPIQRTIYGPIYPPIPATTFRPRTGGLSASSRF